MNISAVFVVSLTCFVIAFAGRRKRGFNELKGLNDGD